MDRKRKNALFLTMLLLAGCVIFSALIFLLVNAYRSNRQLKNLVRELGDKTFYLSQGMSGSQDVIQKAALEQKALDYLEWQFVLKEQVEQGRAELENQMQQFKELGKNKALASILYYNVGLSNFLARDFSAAIRSLEESLNFDPQNYQSCYILGLLYSTYGRDNKKASSYYKKYLELAPAGQKTEEVKERLATLAVQ